jgi:Uma2 family endonuclease
MEVDSTNSKREPDLQIILKSNPGQLTATRMVGPADICIEVVSMESVERDYGRKLLEYEAGGVQEYWLLDPIRQRAVFNRLNVNKFYDSISLDPDYNYQTPVLPGLKLHVPTLWEDHLPDFFAIAELVKSMLKE